MNAPSPLEEHFFALIALPELSRAAYLDDHCRDPELRTQLERMLAASGKAQEFLKRPTSKLEIEMDSGTTDHKPERDTPLIGGRYKLCEMIGQGGMGTVWMAEQMEPVKRKVAVKLIKAGMDSKQVLARFDAERQALALMDHPSIAKVLDGGLHEGRPFFVMELVKGVPITDYCDHHKLTPQERLELFVPVCQAIQHAHQKGIIHRDIKPSNVLIAMYDDKPVPKVIDFGVAKATGGTLTEATIETGFGGVVGTPQYMSPEQATFNNLDIDTRSDVYSLGVLLYELLTGSPPFSKQELEKKGLMEILRVVREEEPPRPSTKLSSADALPTLSARRGTDPGRLTSLLRHELDWIVMKALEKDRSRRYETANGFAADVLRYLGGEPVLAHPPSRGYRLRKFVRRNRPQMIAAGVMLCALLAGITGTTWGFLRAEDQRQNAVLNEQKATESAEAERLAKQNAFAQKEQAEAARREAQAREAEANAVIEFFESKVFAAGRPKGQYGGLGKDVTLKAAIDASMAKLSENFKDQPLIEARLRLALGNTFSYLGENKRASEQFERVLALYSRVCGPEHPNTLAAMNNLAASYSDLGRQPEALKLSEETLALCKRILPPDHAHTRKCMTGLAHCYDDQGRYEEARAIYRQLLEVQKRILPPDHHDTLITMTDLANSYTNLGRHAEALKLNEEALEAKKRVLTPDHPDVIVSMINTANCYHDLGRHPEALKLRLETLAACKRVLPQDHPDTFRSMANLANSYDAMCQFVEALKLNEETLAGRKRVLPLDHPDIFLSMGSLAGSYENLGRNEEALKLRQESLAGRKRILPPDHPHTLYSKFMLANCYDKLGRHQEALQLRKETLEDQIRLLPPDHPAILDSKTNLANSYSSLGQHAEALKLREETLAAQKRILPPDHPSTLGSQSNLANSYHAVGRHAEALKLREETLATQKRVMPPDHPNTLNNLHNLACGYAMTEKFAEAIQLFEELLTKSERADPELVAETLNEWLACCEKLGDITVCRRGAHWFEKPKKADRVSLYTAACYRAITAMIQSKLKGDDSARLAKDDADKAMEWLKKAVAAGFQDAGHIKKDDDLAFLRDRADFKTLLAELEKKSGKK